MPQPSDEISNAKRIAEAVETGVLTAMQIDQLSRNLQMGHKTLSQAELESVLVWAIEIMEDTQLLAAVLDGRLLIGVENGKILYGDPNDVAQ